MASQAINNAELISALNRVNQSLRTSSIAARLFSLVIDSIVKPFKILDNALNLFGISVRMLSDTIVQALTAPWEFANRMDLVKTILIDMKGVVINGALAYASLIGVVVASTGAVTVAMTAFIAPMAALVSMFDPSIVKLLQLAVGDLLATIGEILRPIIEAVIPIVQQLGSVIATMAPALQPLIQAFIGIMNLIAGLFVPVAEALTPILFIIGNILLKLMPLFEMFVEVLHFLADALEYVTEVIVDMINFLISITPFLSDNNQITMKKFQDLKPETSIGKKALGTSRMSAEEMTNKIRESAFGGSSQAELMGRVATSAERQEKILSNILTAIKDDKKDFSEKLVDETAQAFEAVARQMRAGGV